MALAGSLEIQMSSNIARITSDMAATKSIVTSAMGSVESAVASATKALGALGVGFSASMLIGKINSVIDRMASLDEASKKTGVSIEELSKLQFVAGTAGKDIGSVEQAMGQLAKSMSLANTATSKQAKAFDDLGIKTKDEYGNEKSLNTMYNDIAKALDEYSNGAGKNEKARTLMGKAGADQIPIMARLIELGVVDASITTEQTAAAEAYKIELARLNQQKEILWNTVVTAILPSMEGFVDVLLRASKETGSLGGSIKTLAGDNTITTWADETTLALSGLVDMLAAFAKVMNVIGKGLGGAGATIGAAVAWAQKDKPSDKPALNTEGIVNAWNDLKTQTGAIDDAMVEDINKVMMSYDSLNAKVKASISDRKAANSFLGGLTPGDEFSNNMFGVDKKPDLPTTKMPDKGAIAAVAAELKLYEGALQRLEIELGKISEMTTVQKTAYELEHGSLQKLIPKHAEMLLAVSAEVDKRKEFLAVNKLDIDAYEAMFKVREQLASIQTAANDADKTYIDDLKFQFDLIGKTTIEQQQMNEVRKIELKLRTDLNAAANVVGTSPAERDAESAALIKRAEDQKTAVLASVAARVQAERDWATGARQAFNDYMDNATNAALQTKNAFATAFKGAEDAVFNFFRHGKLGMADFISVIEDALARLAAQKFMVTIVGSVGMSAAGVAGAAATPGGAAGSSLSSLSSMSSIGSMFSKGATGVTGMANGVFQDAGVAMGSQWIADIGNYGFGLPFISGLVMAATGNVAGGVGSMIGGIAGSYFGPIGTMVGSALGGMIGSMIGGGGGDRQAQDVGNYLTGSVSRGGLSGGGVTTMIGTPPNDYWGGSRSAAIPADALTAFNKSVAEVFASMEAQAKALNIDTSALASISVQAANSGKGVQQDMIDVLAKTSDTIATTLIPNIAALQQSGESLTQTFVRITNAQIAAKLALDNQRRQMEIQLMELQGNAVGALAAKREDELKALDPSLAALQLQIYAAQDLAASATGAANAVQTLAQQITTAQQAATAAVSAEIQASSSAANTAHRLADTYRQISTNLTAEITKIIGAGKSSASEVLNQTFSAAMGGDVSALQALPKAADDYLAASMATATSANAYARDQGKVVDMLQKANSAAVASINWEEHNATLLETQVAVLEQVKAELGKVDPNTKILEGQLALLDTIHAALLGQTVQVIDGNLFIQDQTGKIIAGNDLSAEQVAQITNGNGITASQLVELIAGNALTQAQIAQLNAGNALTVDQVAQIGVGNALLASQIVQIMSGNTLTSEQVAQVAAGNALTANQIVAIMAGNSLTAEQVTQLVAGNATSTQQVLAILAGNLITADQLTQLVAGNTMTSQQVFAVLAGNVLTQSQIAEITASNTLNAQQVVAILTGNTITAQQLTQLSAGNALTSDQILAILTGNTITADQLAALSSGNALTTQQVTAILAGNTITADQLTQLTAGNALTLQQVTAILAGNALTDAQSTLVLTGNTIQDAVKSITLLNSTYSRAMLTSLVSGSTVQGDSLDGIALASNTTATLLQTLVDLTKQSVLQNATAAEVAKTAADEAAAKAAGVAADAKRLSDAQAALATSVVQQSALVASVNAGITGINSLVSAYGVNQQTASGGAAAQLYVDSAGILQNTSQYQVLGGYTNSDFAGFKAEFWKAGGVYDQTYGQAAQLQAIADNIAAQKAIIAAIPGHALGLSYVPSDDYLMRAHKGEAVLTAPQAASWRSGGAAANDEVLAELRALRQESVGLRQEVAGLRQVSNVAAQSVKKHYDLIRNMTPDGQRLQTVAT